MAGVFIFCVDDHPSMASAPVAKGAIFSHIDIARSGVDAFLAYYAKHKLHSPLMLLRPAADKSCIRSYIGDPVNIFEREIKNLAAGDGNSGSGAASASGSSAIQSKVEPSDFSYAMSMAFGVINKHRLRNGVDHFGHGRYPWILEPTTVFLFTNRLGQSAHNFEMENKLGVASEYVTEPQKWDHRVYLFVLQGDYEGMNEEEGPVNLSTGLVELCTITGGDVFVVHSMAEARTVMTRIMSSLCSGAASCAIRLGIEHGEFDKFDSQSIAAEQLNSSLVRITGRRVGEWPIPEDFPIEKDSEELPPRVPVPCLNLSSDDFGVYRAGTLTLTQCMQAVKDYDVPHNVYSIRGKLQELDLQQGHMYYVSMSVSTANALENKRDTSNNSSDGRPGTPTLRAGVEANRDDFFNTPFAILSDECNDGEDKGTRHLILLPFNFPRCFALIQKGRDVMRKQIAASSNPANFSSMQSIDLSRSIDVWKRDFAQYISSIPGYYRVPTTNMMQHLGLQSLAQSVKVQEYTLHPKPLKKLRFAAENASFDIRDMENVSQQKWLRSEIVNPPAYIIAFASSALAQQTLPVGPFTSAMPHTASRGKSPAFIEHLAGTWEKMRQVVYGRGSGSFVNGLSVRGVSGTVGHVPAGNVGTDWLADACGAAQVPCEVVKEMSNYMHILARQECPRDALEIACPAENDDKTQKDVAEEDTERGILKRKLETVNFGNRYKKNNTKSKLSDSSRDIGVSEVLNSNASQLTPGDSGTSDMAGVFGDTPRPDRDYSQTFMLEEAVLLSSQASALSSMSTTTDSAVKSSNLELTSAQANRRYRSAADLPPLGLPRRDRKVTAGNSDATATTNGSAGIAVGNGISSSGNGTRKSPVVLKTGSIVNVDSMNSSTSTSAAAPYVSNSGSAVSGSTNVNPVNSSVHISTASIAATAAPGPAAVTAGNSGWEIQFSAKYGRNYWFNTRTGKSSWEDPHKK